MNGFFCHVFFRKTPIVKSLCPINTFIIWNTLQYLHFIFKTNIISYNTCIRYLLFLNLVSSNDLRPWMQALLIFFNFVFKGAQSKYDYGFTILTSHGPCTM